jgi:hypothetical protein
MVRIHAGEKTPRYLKPTHHQTRTIQPMETRRLCSSLSHEGRSAHPFAPSYRVSKIGVREEPIIRRQQLGVHGPHQAGSAKSHRVVVRSLMRKKIPQIPPNQSQPSGQADRQRPVVRLAVDLPDNDNEAI